MDFYNPYIHNKGKSTFRKKPVHGGEFQDLSRLVPVCLKSAGSRELVTVKTSSPPVVFVGDSCSQIVPRDGPGFWAPDDPPASQVGDYCRLRFHVYDIVETYYSEDRLEDVPLRFQGDVIPGGTVLKLLGRLDTGQTICVNVFRQKLYFYVSGGEAEAVSNAIKGCLRDSKDRHTSFFIPPANKRILEKYDRVIHRVWRVEMVSQSSIWRISDRLRAAGFRLYESAVDAVTRFVLDNKFGTFGWYSAVGATRRQQNKRDSWTDLEFDCAVEDLSFDPSVSDWPPYRVLSFDIECIGDAGFPSAANLADMIIQISCVVWRVDASDYRKMLLTIGTCSDLEGVEVYQFPSELDLLYGFLSLIRDAQVEFLTGYNIANFDLQYVVDRASQLYNIDPCRFCRVKTGARFEVVRPRESLGCFARASSKIKISGLVPIDMYGVCKDKMNLSDYKLNTVAGACLGTKKDDVSYKEIPLLFRQGGEGRARVGRYCVLDSVLVMDLLRYFMTHVEISEIARLSRIPVRRVLGDGQQIRVFTCLLAAAAEDDYILPTPHRENGEGYQGATVINPRPGFYNEPVLVVDFASLYPSIIQAHNLCYSTMIPHAELGEHPYLTPADYETHVLPSGPIHFVKPRVTKSLLSSLLTAWLKKRKDIRRELAGCADPVKKIILDKQQLAIKVTCNSVYGFTGVASGLLPCIRIAETVTCLGRQMLDRSRDFVDALSVRDLERICGRPLGVRDETAGVGVIYGDTDSLFVLCRGMDLATVQMFAEPLAAHVTETLFVPPIKLEAEKIFECLMMLTKKRYIGILPDQKLAMKGVDLIRKTACRFVQRVCRRILDLILKDSEVKAAAQEVSRLGTQGIYAGGIPKGFCKVTGVLLEALRDLTTGRVGVDELVFTNELSRPISVYKNTCLPHLRVYQKKINRGEEPPQLHDRIPYVFVRGAGDKITDLAEDPDFVIKNGIPPAVDLYFDKLIHGAANILQCLFQNDCDATVAVLYNFLPIPASFNNKTGE